MKLKIIVHPNSKNPRVEKDLLGIHHVHVKEPPINDKANKAVMEAIAHEFKRPVGQVRILHGNRSKVKLVELLAN